MTGPNRIRKDTHAPARKPSKARKMLEFTKMFGRKAAVAGGAIAISAVMLIGGKAVAQEPAKPPVMAAATQAPASGAGYQSDVKKTAAELTAQVNFNPPKKFDFDPNKLDKVTLKEMQELDTKSEEFRKTAVKNVVTRETSDHETFFYGMGIPVPGQNWTIETTVFIGHDAYRNIERNDVIVTRVKNGKRVGVEYDLSALSRLYKKLTGKEMKTARIIGEQGHDPKLGNYISINIVPNDDVNAGTPFMAISYYNNSLHEPSMWIME